MRGKADEDQLDFDALFREVESRDGWPDPERFPYNHAGAHVADVVRPDLATSRDPLLVVGFTSVDTLVSFLAECHGRLATDPDAHARIRLLVGYEPVGAERAEFGGRVAGLGDEIQAYWLERGISVLLSAKLLRAIDLLESDRVEARRSGQVPVHAKIYRGDQAITLGSSNFTTAGLRRHKEANVR